MQFEELGQRRGIATFTNGAQLLATDFDLPWSSIGYMQGDRRAWALVKSSAKVVAAWTDAVAINPLLSLEEERLDRG